MSDFHLGLIKKDSLSLKQFQRFVLLYDGSYGDQKTITLLESPRLDFVLSVVDDSRTLAMSFMSDTSDSSEMYEYQAELYQCFINRSNCKLLFSTSLKYPFSRNHTSKYRCDLQGGREYIDNDYYCYLFCIQLHRKDIPFVLGKKLVSNLITDCSLLFENNDLTNFVINVENVEFPVHKEILAAKSPVFLAMFKTNLKENTENQMTIEDFNADVIREFLRYIYTNKVEKVELYARDLLMVAEKYDIPKLKSLCNLQLIKSLTVNNALSTLQLADNYNSHELKNETEKFVKRNIKLIIKSDEFKTFPPKLSLLAEIIDGML